MIKTLEELKKVRKESFDKVALRIHSQGTGTGEKIEVRIGTSNRNPSGRETLNAFMDDVAGEGLNNVKVMLVDNYGDQQTEPIVGINMPGHDPIIYKNVDPEKAHEIFRKHIKGGQYHH